MRIEVVYGDREFDDWDIGDADTIVVDFHEQSIMKRSGGFEYPIWTQQTGAMEVVASRHLATNRRGLADRRHIPSRTPADDMTCDTHCGNGTYRDAHCPGAPHGDHFRRQAR